MNAILKPSSARLRGFAVLAMLVVLAACSDHAFAVQIEGIDPVTRKPALVPGGPNGLYTFGQTFPGEDIDVSRIPFMMKDICLVYTADTQLKPTKGMVARIAFLSGTAATAILYDNTVASGPKVFDNSAIGVTPTTGVPGPSYPIGGAFATGLYLDVGGTAPVVQVCWL